MTESIEKREVNPELKKKDKQASFEDVTIIKRVTERTLLAKNVFVSI